MLSARVRCKQSSRVTLGLVTAEEATPGVTGERANAALRMGAADTLRGDQGLDWFISGPGDQILDQEPDEQVN